MKASSGGETEIRTQERVAPLPVFKTGAFNRSATPPRDPHLNSISAPNKFNCVLYAIIT